MDGGIRAAAVPIMNFRLPAIAAYLAAALLGFGYFCLVYDWGFLSGQGSFWLVPHPDQMQALTGWYAYAHDAWRLPLFEVENLRYPQGANIIFTDSIPLLALAFKPFTRWLPTDFHYFGLWIGLCFVMQSVGAMAVLRAVRVRNPLILVSGLVMALSVPAWLVRHNHLALCGHFLILLGILLYLRTQSTERPTRMIAPWSLLAAATLLIHLYLLAMVMALLLAAWTQRLFSQRANWKHEWLAASAAPLVVAAVIVVVGMLSGHFRGEAVTDASRGFGTYSMNLLSPWYPQQVVRLPGGLPVFDATGGQYEGFNYMGIGALAMLLLAIAFSIPRIRGILRGHGVLVALMLFFTMFALSNRVYWGETAVLKYRVPHLIDKPVELFRSSGRFFWAVSYLLILGGVAILARQQERHRWISVVIAGLAALQLVDTEPSRAFPRIDTRQAESPILPPAIWRPLLASHSLLRVLPGFSCGPAENHRVNQELQLLAARSGVPVTTVFMARQVDDCVAERELVDTLQPSHDELVVYLPPFGLEQTKGSFPEADACRQFLEGIACSQKLLDPAFALPEAAKSGAEDYFRSFAPPPPPLRPGDTVDVALGSPATEMLLSGWFATEPDGAWMRGKRAVLQFGVPHPPPDGLRFRFRSKCYLSPKHPQKTLTISVNGEISSALTINTWEPADRELFIPSSVVKDGQSIRVSFEIDPVSSPVSDGVSADNRELGIQLQRIEVLAATLAP